MHKRKEDLRDIYRGADQDIEKDFTPQVAKARQDERQRDLRRTRVYTLLFGTLAILLAVALVSIVIRDFLAEKKPSRTIRAKTPALIPQHTLPADSLWIMEYHANANQLDRDEKPGPKPLSTKWVKNAAYHIVMGQQALVINEKDRALEHFSKVTEMFPDIEGLHGAMGTLFLQNQDYPRAIQHLEKALQEEESFDAVNNLGAACMGAADYPKAEKHFQRALEMRPENPGCYKNLALLYRKMKRDHESVSFFERYLDLQPNDPDTLQSYAIYLTGLGRWKDAATYLTRLTTEVPDIAPVYFLLAQVQIQNGQQEKAIEALKRGIQLVDPQLALAWMSRDEFSKLRQTDDFKGLVDQLEIDSVSLKKAP